jgi:hypothetical protein
MRRGLLASALVALLAACSGEDYAPQTMIDRLRVLAVDADKPEIVPGDAAVLTPLVIAPGIDQWTDMTRAQSVCLRDRRPAWERLPDGRCGPGTSEAPVVRLWFYCSPSSDNVENSPCANTDTLSSPDQIGNTPGVHALGPGATATVSAPADLFSRLAPDAAVRRHGVLLVTVLVVAIDADGDLAAGRIDALSKKVQENRVPNVLTLRRVLVKEGAANDPPHPSAISFGPGDVTDGLRIGPQTLGVRFDVDPREPYTLVSQDGKESPAKERPIISWLSGFGRFTVERTLYGETTDFSPPDGSAYDRLPPGTSDFAMPLVVVVRDGRGGEGWLVKTVLLAR